MLRIILGVIVGFCVWSILWVAGNQLLMALSPGWYGAQELAFMKAVASKEPVSADSTILLIHIILSVIASFVSGYVAALVAAENRRVTIALGVLLLLVGIMVEVAYWNYIPIWYHLIFLILLIPMTIAGGKLRRIKYA
jgi:hypothetical protein